MTTLLDDVLPRYDFRSRHEVDVGSDPITVAATLEAFRIERDASPFARVLFGVRGIGLPRGTIREVLAGSGFTVLAEAPGREIVSGVLGRFWAARERANLVSPADAGDFVAFDRPGWAKGAVNLLIRPAPGGRTLLSTETRVLCTDERARRRFALYWAAIGPFSGWIRRDLLRAVSRLALKASASPGTHPSRPMASRR